MDFYEYVCRHTLNVQSEQERIKIVEMISNPNIPFSTNDGVKIYRSVMDMYKEQPDYKDLFLRLWESFQAGKVQEGKNITEQLGHIASSLDNICDALCSGSEGTVSVGDSLEQMNHLFGSVVGDRTMSGVNTLYIYDEGRY